MSELQECLKERDTNPAHPALSPIKTTLSPANPNVPDSGQMSPNGAAIKANSAYSGNTTSVRPDKRVIEQRIEEDRERHKRLRESIWAMDGEGHNEFDKTYDDASDVDEDDLRASGEDFEERKDGEIELI